MKNKLTLITLFLISFLIVGCDDFEEYNSYDNYENNSNYLSFQEFKKITENGFDSISINEETYCYEFETYDSYYDECVTDVMCDEELGECDEFDRIYDEFLYYLDNQDYFEEGFEVNHGHNEDIDLVNEFYINKNDTLELITGDNTQTSQEIFNEFSRLIPKKERLSVEYFGTFSDGLDNTLAYVSQRDYENEPQIWYVAVDTIDFEQGSKDEFIHTLIHEYGHILSLQNSQIDYFEFENCNSLQIQEGCLDMNSYLYVFYKTFWKEEIYTKHLELVEEYGEEDASYELYNLYSNQFVSEYAATNIVEDFAESFTTYVLSSNSNIDNSIEKVQFFNQFEELKELRNEIRNNLDKNKRSFKNN